MTVEDQSGENALPRQWPLFHSVDLWIFTGSKPSIILEQYKSTQDQIVAHLLQFVGQNPQHITEHLEISVLFQIARFWKNTLQTLGHSLDAIDYSISDDARIVENLKRWRYLLGIWRPLVPRFRSELEESINNLIDTGIFFEEGPKRVDQLRGIFSEFLVTCTLLQERVERTSQALMSTLSIIESQNAIRQGHEIQKLTELAFVFVPMSFAATYFGMEVHVCSRVSLSIRVVLTLGFFRNGPTIISQN